MARYNMRFKRESKTRKFIKFEDAGGSMQEQSEVTDEQWVKAQYPDAKPAFIPEQGLVLILGDDLQQYGQGKSQTEAWADARRRLPKPDAEAEVLREGLALGIYGPVDVEGSSAQPKPDAAGEARRVSPLSFDCTRCEANKGEECVDEGTLHGKRFHVSRRSLADEANSSTADVNPTRANEAQVPWTFDMWEKSHYIIRRADKRGIAETSDPRVAQLICEAVNSRSAPRNSALEDAAKEMAEALEKSDGTLHKFQVSSYDSSRLEIRAALARFRALGGE